jgi:hypothetical protein
VDYSRARAVEFGRNDHEAIKVGYDNRFPG